MLTRTLVLVASLLMPVSSASASTAPDLDSTLINHPPAYTQVAARKVESAPASLSQRTPQNSDAWMMLNRRVPGSAGDTSYGRDWAGAWGGP